MKLLMTRAVLCFTILLGLPVIAVQDLAAQDHAMGAAKPVTIMAGLGDLHHPVSTKNKEAQEFFDQGLRLIYAFNHDEAARSFHKAAELDPSLAMAYWGIAEAVGPNYNDPASDDRFKEAHEAIQKAVDLKEHGSEAEGGPAEGGGGVSRCHARGREEQSGRSGCRDLVRGGGDESASVGIVAPGRHAGSGDGGDRGHAGVGDQTRSESPGRRSLLHSCGGGVEFSGAGFGGRESPGLTGAGGGTHRAHAGTCLHPYRRLRGGRENESGSRGGRSGL